MPVIYRIRPLVLTVTLLAWATLTVLATPWVDTGEDSAAYRILTAAVAITGTLWLLVLACQRGLDEVWEHAFAAGKRAQIRECSVKPRVLTLRRD